MVTVCMGSVLTENTRILAEGSGGVQTIGRLAAAVHVAEGTDCDLGENHSFCGDGCWTDGEASHLRVRFVNPSHDWPSRDHSKQLQSTGKSSQHGYHTGHPMFENKESIFSRPVCERRMKTQSCFLRYFIQSYFSQVTFRDFTVMSDPYSLDVGAYVHLPLSGHFCHFFVAFSTFIAYGRSSSTRQCQLFEILSFST
jgi:hypothetical protein